MRKLLFHFMILVAIICLFPQITFARTGYVSDMLLLTFRQGPGNSFAITKTLQSDTPVTILEEENDFFKVALQTNEIGWVDKKFIVFEVPKTFIINQLKQETETLKNKILTFEATTGKLKDKILSLENEYLQKTEPLETSLKEALDEKIKISNSLSEIRKKYDTLIEQSKNIQTIVQENKTLQENNLTLSKDLEIFKEKNKTLFKTGMIKWFLSGVGVLLLGWIIGHSVSSKKRQSGSLLN